MFQPITQVNKDPPGQAVTQYVSGNLVESVFTGHQTRQMLEELRDLTPTLLKDVPGMSWLVDLSGVKTSDLTCRYPGKELMEKFRQGGGRNFAAVVPNAGLRMVFSSVALVVRLPVKFFETRAAALAFLRKP